MDDLQSERVVIETMLRRRWIASHHGTEPGILRNSGVPAHELGDVKEAIRRLVRRGVLAEKKTKGNGVRLFLVKEFAHVFSGK